jgi:hypothetical protein
VAAAAARYISSWGRPASGADIRDRIEPRHERIDRSQSFVFRFESGLVRRFAARIDVGPRLCDSVTLWPTSSRGSVTMIL